MNPMTNVKNIQKLNDKVLQLGVEDDTSWHKQYKDSAYIFIGGLPFDLSEGDILCVFSQYGEIIHINLVRDKSTGKSKGYCFICYENQKSTILAVDNLNGIKLGGRTIRVDHVSDYKRPKGDEKDEKGERKELPLVSCAPKTPPSSDNEEDEIMEKEGKKKKKKKDKSKKREKKKNKDAKEINEKKLGMLEKKRRLDQVKEEINYPKDEQKNEKWRKEISQKADIVKDPKLVKSEKEYDSERKDVYRERKHNEMARGKVMDNHRDKVRNEKKGGCHLGEEIQRTNQDRDRLSEQEKNRNKIENKGRKREIERNRR